ncbi:MAG: hypothetical protein WAQ08_21645 [Aquabacterium sp.]|uniref:hypothetical protein n=1 Tax=Aquabacterium sp. TaxID=1872578 RepID=UPI003BB1BBE1
MKRGPYFFVQWRTHRTSTAQHCYVWCQWECDDGTHGVARSVSRHGLQGAIAAVKRAAESRMGQRIRKSVQTIIKALEAQGSPA